MDVVLVGLPGSGKSAVGRRLAHRHDARFVDLDEAIERGAGRSIPELFAERGEAAFRALERQAIADLGPADEDPRIRAVIATGGGAVVDPRNRWALYRRRLPIWLDVRPEVLAQRLRRSPNVRPLIAGRDPMGAIRDLARDRERFYSAANRMNGVAELATIVERVDALAAERAATAQTATVLVRGRSLGGDVVLGDGIMASAVGDALRGLRAGRAILVSEPGAWQSIGAGLATALADEGWPVEHLLLPQGEAAKRLSVLENAAGELARLRVERGEPLVAVGGGALGDAAGFLAATWLRGVPLVQVPTTLVAQIDSSIGGKTGVDLAAGKNLVGAFHPPASIAIDIAALRTLPERQRRAALGEAVKMAALGDERLFGLLEREGDAIASGDEEAFASGAVAELVERTAWAKVGIVETDEKEGAADRRITLNLGHSLGHAVEAAGGFGELFHGEAVAHGLRGAVRIGRALGVTPPERADRIEAVLTSLDLATSPLPYPLDTVLGALAADKKHASGALRWVLPTADGSVVRADVPTEVVERAAASLLVAPGVAA